MRANSTIQMIYYTDNKGAEEEKGRLQKKRSFRTLLMLVIGSGGGG